MSGAMHASVKLTLYVDSVCVSLSDPYGTSDNRSSLYPSGLLGLSVVDETSRDSHPDSGVAAGAVTPPEASQSHMEEHDQGEIGHEEHTNDNDDDDGNGGYPDDSTAMYAAVHHGDDDPNRRFDDAEMTTGWVGSFREQNDDDDYQAQQQREAEEQEEQAQFAAAPTASVTRTRRRSRSDDRSGSSSGSSDRSGDGDGDDDRDRRTDSEDEGQQDDGYGGVDPSSSSATPALYTAAAPPSATTPFLPPPPAPPSMYPSYAPSTPIAQHRNNLSMAGQYGSSYSSSTLPAAHLSLAQQYAAASPSSPMYSYSPRHPASYSPSPHLGPTSPRVHSQYYGASMIPYGSTSAGASSPRQDTIASVTHRIEYMQRAGRLNQLLHTAGRFNQEVAGYTSTVAPIPDYHNLTSSAGVARSSSKQPLISIDQHLLRRYMFSVLDSDMIIRGVVVNKNQNMGLVINIAQILWPTDKPREMLAKQQQAAQQSIAQIQGQKEPTTQSGIRAGSTSVHCFPPLSSFLGGIHSASPPGAHQSMHPSSAPSSSLSSDPESTFPTEHALFANFDVLSIHGECHLAEMCAPVNMKPSDIAAGLHTPPTASLERFALGDQVKTLVISVDIHSEKVYLSMNQNRLRGPVASLHKLGVIPKDALKSDSSSGTLDSTYSSLASKLKPDLQDKIASFGSNATTFNKNNATNNTPNHINANTTPNATNMSHLIKTRTPFNPKLHPSTTSLSLLSNPLLIAKARNFLAYLHDQPLFKNPEGVNKLTGCYHINQFGSLKGKMHIDQANMYKNLRHRQNQSWAKESVVKGISLAKKGSSDQVSESDRTRLFENAMKCYKHALDIEPNFTQAYVARGAAYVLQGSLKKAIGEFESALKIDPQQPYALTYLQAAKEKLMGGRNANATGGSNTPAHKENATTTSHAANNQTLTSTSSQPPSVRQTNSAIYSIDRSHPSSDSHRRDSTSRRSSDVHKSSKKRSRRSSVDRSSKRSHRSGASSDAIDRGESDSESSSDESNERSRSRKKERKKSRKRHKSEKSERKERRRAADKAQREADRDRSTINLTLSDDSTDASRSSSRSSTDHPPSAHPPVFGGSSSTPPFPSPPPAGMEVPAHATMAVAVTVTEPSAAQPAPLAPDEDWFGESNIAAQRIEPQPAPRRADFDTPDAHLSPHSFGHSDDLFAASEGDSDPIPFTSDDPHAALTIIHPSTSPTGALDAAGSGVISPPMQMVASMSANSIAGFALSPSPEANQTNEPTQHPTQ